MTKNNTNNSKPKRSDIALEWIRQTFEGNATTKLDRSTPATNDDCFDINGALSSVTGNAGEVLPRKPTESSPIPQPFHKQLAFGFTEEGWKRLQEVGVNIGTTEPSQIVRRALAVLWLVALGHCSLKDNVTGKTVHIPE